MAFTNGKAPFITGVASGILPQVVSDGLVNTATTVAGDFVGPKGIDNTWPVYAANGALLGGIYLGRDAGSITNGAVVIGTPGIDAFGPGVYGGNGPVGAAATYGNVQVITPDTLLAIDLVEGTTMTTLVPGLLLSLLGATRVSASSGGWYVELNANTANGLDNAVELVEVLAPSSATLRGRVVVRCNQHAILNTAYQS